MLNQSKTLALLVLSCLLSCWCYYAIGYDLARHESSILIPSYFLLFVLYLWLSQQGDKANNYRYLLLFGFVARILLLFSIPTLSDDVYRFIWDGRLLVNGINPFIETPGHYLNQDNLIGINQELYNHLNSPNYHSVYPPVTQFIFWISAAISPTNITGSIIVMRIINIIADLAGLWFMIQLLAHYKIHKTYALLYFINPLVILELTGNLHHEGLLLCFILGALHFANKNKWNISGAYWALAVATKLLPVIFLPYLMFRNKLSHSIKLFSSFLVISLLLFLPFYNSQMVDGMISSLGLYFQKFEFNASIYYLARSTGVWITGYNPIHIIGPMLALSTLTWILFISIRYRKLQPLEVMTLIIVSYFFLSTTVHPWYIITALGLSIFTMHRFIVLWTLLIFLSYSGYTTNTYIVNYWLLATEYLAVFSAIIYEWNNNKSFFKRIA